MITLLLLILAGTPSPPSDASLTRRGLVNTTTQSFSGKKTFLDGGVTAESLTVSSSSSDAGFEVLTATKEAMTLYVDLDGGSDSSACTGGDSGVCLTIQGAINKVPKRVRHNVTVNAAAGTYVENVKVSSFIFDNSTATPAITITGALVALVPATGTASGTFTSAAAVASGAYVQRITDAAQTWTVNDLQGHFITVAGVSRPIISNTATTIDVASTTAFTGGTAYTLVTTEVTINPASSNALTLTGNVGNGTITVSSLALSDPTSIVSPLGQSKRSTVSVGVQTTLTNVRTSAGASGTVTCQGAECAFTRSSWSVLSTAVTCAGNAICGFSETYLRSSTTSSFAGILTLAAGGLVDGSSVAAGNSLVIEATSTSGIPVVISPFGVRLSGMPIRGRFVCPTGSTRAAILNSPTATSGYNILAAPVRFQNSFSALAVAFEIEECSIGFQGYGDVWLANNTSAATAWYFNNVTTAFDLGYGARAILGPGSTFTFTNVVNQFRLDGTVYTLTDLDTANPQLLSTPYFTLLAR